MRALALLAFLPAIVSAEIEAKKISTPADATRAALIDINSVPPEHRPFQRYIWVQEPSADNEAIANFVTNMTLTRTAALVRGVPVAGGLLLRYDLQQCSNSIEELKNVINNWEKLLNNEPYFHITEKIVEQNRVSVPPYKASDGRTYNFRVEEKVRFVNAFSMHADLPSLLTLADQTQTQVPIVKLEYYVRKALAVTNDGLYYDFIGAERNPKGKTAQAAFFEKFGIDEKKVQQLKADERAALTISGVTHKPRRIDLFYAGVARPSFGPTLVTITHDITDESVEAKQDPIENLIEFEEAAQEIIFSRQNGLPIFLIFDGNGNLQNTVPDNVAVDHSLIYRSTKRVEPAISCLRCHGPHELLIPFRNHVREMLLDRDLRKIEVFGDLSNLKRDPQEVYEILSGYLGELRIPLEFARISFTNTVKKLTGKTGQEITAMTVAMYDKYWLEPVTTTTALRDLGYLANETDATNVFNLVVPPLPPNSLGFSPESVTIHALRKGDIPVTRVQWERNYSGAAVRTLLLRKDSLPGASK